jgi:predicted nucleic acid-binding protein
MGGFLTERIIFWDRLIISGDKHHLQPLKEYQGIKILSPAQFLEITELGFQ